MEYLHQREIAGVNSHYLDHWGPKKMNGLYMIENRLADSIEGQRKSPIFLMPGVFDPVRGEFGEDLIQYLLTECSASSVYEAHFQSRGICGLLDIESVLEDLMHIYRYPKEPCVMVGLSGGAMTLGAALWQVTQQGCRPCVRAALLISPYFPGYDTFFIRLARRVIENEEILAKVTKHSGHEHVPKNVDDSLAWYEGSSLKPIFDQANARHPSLEFPVPIETKYFRFDIMSNKGRTKLHALFNCKKPQKVISGMHRGLFRVPETNQVVGDFVSRYSTSIAKIENKNLA